MAITVEEPGRRVRVTPVGGVSLADVFEYAELAILGYGFRQGPHDADETEVWERPAKYGLSLHDAVGYAFVRLTSSGSKDGALYRDENASFSRGEAYAQIAEAIEKEMAGAREEWEKASAAGVTVLENWFNNTTDEDTVIRVLRIAREEAAA